MVKFYVCLYHSHRINSVAMIGLINIYNEFIHFIFLLLSVLIFKSILTISSIFRENEFKILGINKQIICAF